MRKFKILPLLLLLLTLATSAAAQKKTQKTYIPWSNGKLVVSEEGRYLKHENGTPFFWLGETGWLLPERLNRDEAEYYLEQCKRRGYNVIQVQTLNNVPSMNIYGQYSMTDGYNFKNINQKGVYGYWDHMDYIIRTAAKKGLYIGMVCIWGSPVSHGEMNVDQAKAYGKFLAERYKDEIMTEIEEVDAVIGTTSYQHIAEVVAEVLEGQKVKQFDDLQAMPEVDVQRIMTTGGYSSYLKIAEGCDKHCTYCIIPKVRGDFRSVPMEHLLEEAQNLVKEGKLLGTVLCDTQLHAKALLEFIEAFGINQTGAEGLKLEDERYYMIPLDTIERENEWNETE